MIEVTIDSVRVSLMSQHRVVVLKEMDGERYLPIWIGPFEADAITIQLQGVEVARPMTHDLLMRFITTLGAQVQRVIISDLQDETFYALIMIDVTGELLEVDARPSDALALAVRARVPIYVDENVMDRAGILPEQDVREEGTEQAARAQVKEDDDAGLEIFRDFVEGLDLEGFAEA